jgi:DNA-binding HxlR family transcriptional regulator
VAMLAVFNYFQFASKCKIKYLQIASIYTYFYFVKKKQIAFRSDCPISTALDILGDKWSLLVLRDMIFKGKNTYGDFLSSGEKIATNILADRLATLEGGGIILRKEHPDSKLKILYTLTQKGIDLVPVLVELIIWSEQYHKVHPQAVAFAKQVRHDKAAVISSVKESLKAKK